MTTHLSRLRTSTLDIHKKIIEKAPSPPKRKELGYERSASLSRAEGHDCEQVEELAAAEKAVRRIWGAYFRLSVSYFLDCKTSRGTTDLVGVSSKQCQCQGSHWNLTPTLLDNIIERVIKEIITKGISPRKELYCKNALQFTEEQIQELKENNDPVFVDNFFRTHVPQGTWNQSFKNTAWKEEANSTIENHARSNTVDSMLELRVRSLEDDINQECYEKKIRPELSLKNLVEKIDAHFTQSLALFKETKNKIARFAELNKEIENFIQTTNPETASASDLLFADKLLSFFKNIEELLELREHFNTKNGTNFRFKKDDEYREDFYTLKTHLKEFERTIGKAPRDCKLEELAHSSLENRLKFFFATRSQFKKATLIDPQNHLKEYSHYIQETEFQQKWTQKYNDIDVINQFSIEFFGIFNPDTKKREAPSDLEMQMQLLHSMTKTTDSVKTAPPNKRKISKLTFDSPPVKIARTESLESVEEFKTVEPTVS